MAIKPLKEDIEDVKESTIIPEKAKPRKSRRDLATFLFTPDEIDALKLILSTKDDLELMIDWFKNSEKYLEEDKLNPGVLISGLQDTKVTSFRVSKKIHEEFNKTCRQNKEFTKTDLLNMALDEFNKKYYKKRKRVK